jgi:hypothetical protein
MATDYDEYRKNIARKLAPAITEAEGLLQVDQYDEAERAIKDIEPSLDGDVAVKELYRRRLEQLVASDVTADNRNRVGVVFQRAVRWANIAYPEPWSQVEFENYAAGRVSDRARLVGIIGYDPELP